MRSWIAGAVVVAAALIVAALVDEHSSGPASGPAGPLLAIDSGGGLVRVDPRSLRRIGRGRLPLDAPGDAWAYSPDRSRLALIAGGVLRFVDAKRVSALGAVRLGARGPVAAVAWSRPDRVIVVLGCCASGATTLVAVDPRAGKVVSRRRLDAGLARVVAAEREVVLLLAPPTLIGPASVTSVDGTGATRAVRLNELSAGVLPGREADLPAIGHTRLPGLAVDPQRRRAYVVPARREVAEIDLATRSVRYHRLAPRVTLLDRLRNLLEPSAQAATAAVGPARSAVWLGAGRIAVTGYDGHVSWPADRTFETGRRPAGLRVIDTEDWSVRTLDERATEVVAAAGLLLTGGSRGLTAYRPEGTAAFRLLDSERVAVVGVADPLAYVRADGALRVVDLDRHTVAAADAGGLRRLLTLR